MTALANPINTDLIGEAMNNSNIILESINIIDQINDAIESLAMLAQDSDNIDAKHVGRVLGILQTNLAEVVLAPIVGRDKPCPYENH